MTILNFGLHRQAHVSHSISMPSKDGKEYLFQVTTNLTAKKTAAHKFAIRYGFIHRYCIYQLKLIGM